MSDFDNINSLEEYDELVKVEERKKMFKFIYKVLVFSFAGLVGFLIYLLLSFVLDKGPNETELNINSTDVRTLYSYVTYGSKGVRGNKFIFNDYVDINSFNNEEKFYYALQFADEKDFVYDENYNKNNTSGNRIYVLHDSTIKKYMNYFFGRNVTYSNNYNFNYTFQFSKNKKNTARLSSNASGGFDVVFDSYVPADNKNSLESYYTSLYQAVRLDDGTVKLREKIVYLDNTKNGDNNYTVNIYKDRTHTKLLGQMNNVTEEVLKYGSIDFNSIQSCGYIEYTFSLDGESYHFKNSKIVYD